jgi:peptidoglycan/xylan/chitin deacetylase (PgdA/CDA1 family)
MATNTPHIRALVGPALAALTAILVGFASPAAASATGAGTTSAAAPCPLRLPARLPERSRVVPILMYHRVNVVTASTPAVTRRLTVHPTVFARQMRWLKRHGYHTITQRRLFDALMCGRPLPSRPILITFDDGYRDTLFRASPVLVRLGMKATAYVITGRTSNGDVSFLGWRHLVQLERRGVEIGSHTVSHRQLPSLSDSAAFAELVRSRRVLERRLGHRVPWLAYPIGAFDSRIERLARRAGYVLAVTTQHGTRQSARRPLALPRLRIIDSTGVRGLARMLGH